MKRSMCLAIAAACALTSAMSAHAADVSPRPPAPAYTPAVQGFDWTGFYLGINGGGAWGDSDWNGLGVSNSPGGGMFGVTTDGDGGLLCKALTLEAVEAKRTSARGIKWPQRAKATPKSPIIEIIPSMDHAHAQALAIEQARQVLLRALPALAYRPGFAG